MYKLIQERPEKRRVLMEKGTRPVETQNITLIKTVWCYQMNKQINGAQLSLEIDPNTQFNMVSTLIKA